MKLSEVRRLRPGDEVFWNDPDGGLCSRVLHIAVVSVYADEADCGDEEDGVVVVISDRSGDTLECFASELS